MKVVQSKLGRLSKPRTSAMETYRTNWTYEDRAIARTMKGWALPHARISARARSNCVATMCSKRLLIAICLTQSLTACQMLFSLEPTQSTLRRSRSSVMLGGSVPMCRLSSPVVIILRPCGSRGL